MRGPAEDTLLDPATTLERLRPVLEDPKVAKVNQNIKYDLQVFRQNGVSLQGVVRRSDGGRLSLARRRAQP